MLLIKEKYKYIEISFLIFFLFNCSALSDNNHDVISINDRGFYMLIGNVHAVTEIEYPIDSDGEIETNGKKTRVSFFEKNGSLESIVETEEGYNVFIKTFLIDDNGNRDSVVSSFTGDERLLSKYEVVNKKQLKVYHYLNTDTLVDEIETWYFNNDGHLIKKESKGIASFQSSSDVIYIYENDRKVKEKIFYEMEDDLDSTIKFFYADSIVVNTYAEGKLDSKRFELFTEKDEIGNWIKGEKTFYLNHLSDTLKYFMEREIIYW